MKIDFNNDWIFYKENGEKTPVTLPHDGNYLIVANSVSRSTGPYTLSVQSSQGGGGDDHVRTDQMLEVGQEEVRLVQVAIGLDVLQCLGVIAPVQAAEETEQHTGTFHRDGRRGLLGTGHEA